MQTPPLQLGALVHYVIDTPFGHYVLPARVVTVERDGGYTLRIYTDVGGSEWMVMAKFSSSKEVGTCHLKEEGWKP